jgi:hypothetical protein
MESVKQVATETQGVRPSGNQDSRIILPGKLPRCKGGAPAQWARSPHHQRAWLGSTTGLHYSMDPAFPTSVSGSSAEKYNVPEWEQA